MGPRECGEGVVGDQKGTYKAMICFKTPPPALSDSHLCYSEMMGPSLGPFASGVFCFLSRDIFIAVCYIGRLPDPCFALSF